MGGYESFVALIPQELASKWWQPFERGGYKVTPFDEQYYDRLDRVGVPRNNGALFSRIISLNSSSAEIHIERNASHWEVYILMSNCNQQFVTDAARILVACGARTAPYYFKCQGMYHCAKGKSVELVREIENWCIPPVMSLNKTGKVQVRKLMAGSFPRGKIHLSGLTMNYITGPALNVQTWDEEDFVVFDYQLPLLRKRKRMKEWILHMEQKLIQRGAVKFNVLPLPNELILNEKKQC